MDYAYRHLLLQHETLINQKLLYATGASSVPANLSSLALSMTLVLLLWDPPPTSNTNCPPITYIVMISSASLDPNSFMASTTDHITSKIVDNLTQQMDYIFTVAGVDVGGRVGELSAPLQFAFGKLVLGYYSLKIVLST